MDTTKNIELIRQKVEDIPVDYFKQLQENDILFIDSSHIIRPENDVLFEYLEILPVLNKGVIIHIHDIFHLDTTVPIGYKMTFAFGTNNTYWKLFYIIMIVLKLYTP